MSEMLAIMAKQDRLRRERNAKARARRRALKCEMSHTYCPKCHASYRPSTYAACTHPRHSGGLK